MEDREGTNITFALLFKDSKSLKCFSFQESMKK